MQIQKTNLHISVEKICVNKVITKKHFYESELEFSSCSVGATAEHVSAFDFLPWLCCLLATCGALRNTSHKLHYAK